MLTFSIREEILDEGNKLWPVQVEMSSMVGASFGLQEGEENAPPEPACIPQIWKQHSAKQHILERGSNYVIFLPVSPLEEYLPRLKRIKSCLHGRAG